MEWLREDWQDLLALTEDWIRSGEAEMDTTQEVQRVIYRCGRKGCKHVWAHDYLVEKRPYGGYRSGYIIALYRIVEDENGKRRIEQGLDFACPKCQGRIYTKASEVVGTVSDHKCDSRCTGARGPNCECSCGGANHGSSWL